MSKVNLQMKIMSQEDEFLVETKAIYNENILKWNDKNTKYKLDLDQEILYRDTLDLFMTFDFKKETIKLFLKEQMQNTEIKCKVQKIVNKDLFFVDYVIISNEELQYTFEVKWK